MASQSFITSTGVVTVVTSSSGIPVIINTSPDAGVAAALAKVGSAVSPTAPINASVTLTGAIPEFVPVDTSSGPVTITIPAISSLSQLDSTRRFVFKKVSSDSNAVTIHTSGSDTIESASSLGSFSSSASFSGSGESHTYFGYMQSSKWMRSQ